jgi:dTDP-glucose pyrophosphorylase
VVRFDAASGVALSIKEKPISPKSHRAVTDAYLEDDATGHSSANRS